jgi:Cu-processing system permease protein
MSSLVQFLISIIGLILGYAAIVGEIERGSMSSLLTLPTTRNEILFGKFLGLGSVLTFTIVVGFGIAGIVIGINVPNVDYFEYLIFIIASILMGLVFLSLGLFLSCLFKRRSTAMGGAIFLWFLFSIIWRFIAAAVLIFTTTSEEIGSFSLPDWYFGLQIFNPLDAYSALVSLNIGSIMTLQQEIGDIIFPSFYTSEVMFLILIIWLVVSFLLAFWRFKQRDI